MLSNAKKMPTRNEMETARKRLLSAGWDYLGSIMVSDVHQSQQYDFGLIFTRDRETFYLNHWTIDNLPV